MTRTQHWRPGAPWLGVGRFVNSARGFIGGDARAPLRDGARGVTDGWGARRRGQRRSRGHGHAPGVVADLSEPIPRRHLPRLRVRLPHRDRAHERRSLPDGRDHGVGGGLGAGGTGCNRSHRGAVRTAHCPHHRPCAAGRAGRPTHRLSGQSRSIRLHRYDQQHEFAAARSRPAQIAAAPYDCRAGVAVPIHRGSAQHGGDQGPQDQRALDGRSLDAQGQRSSRYLAARQVEGGRIKPKHPRRANTARLDRRGATEMEYISAILGHVVPIISEASKSQFGLMSLIALIALAIVLLFLYLTARTRPVLSFVLALVAILLMFGGVVGLVLSVDVRKPAIVYDVDMLQRLQTVGFKIPHLEDATSTDYELLDGMLQRQPDGTWHERQEQPRGREVL